MRDEIQSKPALSQVAEGAAQAGPRRLQASLQSGAEPARVRLEGVLDSLPQPGYRASGPFQRAGLILPAFKERDFFTSKQPIQGEIAADHFRRGHHGAGDCLAQKVERFGKAAPRQQAANLVAVVWLSVWILLEEVQINWDLLHLPGDDQFSNHIRIVGPVRKGVHLPLLAAQPLQKRDVIRSEERR